MTFLRDWWLSMGHWRWLNVMPVVIALYLAAGYEAMPSDWIDRGERALGEASVRLYTRGAVRAGEELPVRIRLSEVMAVEIGFDDRSMLRLEVGDSREQQVETELQVPENLYDNAHLLVRGQDQQARWRIGRLIL